MLQPPFKLRERELLAPHTTWKIGGRARWLAEPSIEELPVLVNWAFENEVPVYYLGRGSNVLIDDAELPGLFILTCNSMTGLWRNRSQIIAESGVFLPHVSKLAARAGFSGYEFMIGIPGTVGGALAMNAGLTAFRPREIASVVDDFDVLNPDGSVNTLTINDIDVGYRKTSLLNGKRFILRVRFRLENQGDPEVIRRHTFEHLAERKRKQPLDKPTAGSTFKSPPGSKGAGWYIDQAGLKGFQIGHARISPVHANWIENMGGAKASDVWQLMTYVQQTVEMRVGTKLEPEICFLPKNCQQNYDY